MPYLHFISTKLDSKRNKIKDLDVTFQMHSINKIFDIVKFLKNEKNQKLKIKRERIGKMAQKGPKGKKAQIFFQAKNSHKNEKNEHS